MRGVIDAEKYTRIGLIDTLEPHELKQKHQIAGMVRSVTPKISKAGRKFAILTLEDFTGSIEVLLWSDVYEKDPGNGGWPGAGRFRLRASQHPGG